jgi:hypothetical protein
MLDAVEKFIELSCENPPILRVFSLWFRTQWPQVFRLTGEEEKVYAEVRRHYELKDRAKFFADFLPRYFAAASTKPAGP